MDGAAVQGLLQGVAVGSPGRTARSACGWPRQWLSAPSTMLARMRGHAGKDAEKAEPAQAGQVRRPAQHALRLVADERQRRRGRAHRQLADELHAVQAGQPQLAEHEVESALLEP
ncbi:hypothetical protein [Achromobacter sp. DMS1]|uniref:hypothetical protein n=1 Tax=Achromobacter sp. DMS1 TaxID=1688405 RepID=UPI0006A001CE|nr:hypothetical protein [Achromobacter sp. DMS1]